MISQEAKEKIKTLLYNSYSIYYENSDLNHDQIDDLATQVSNEILSIIEES